MIAGSRDKDLFHLVKHCQCALTQLYHFVSGNDWRSVLLRTLPRIQRAQCSAFSPFLTGVLGLPSWLRRESICLACNAGDPGSIPGSGRSPGEGNGKPLQYSCLENPSRLQSTESQRVGHNWATSHSPSPSGTEGVGTYVTLIECRVWGRLEEAQGRQSKESPKSTVRKRAKKEIGKSTTVTEVFTPLI